MKLLFFGDSITDAERYRGDTPFTNALLGYGYVMQIAGRLYERSPVKYEIVNKGIGGHRIVDLYSRIKCDVWNEKPDVLTIFVGINDIWHEIDFTNGVDLERFERMYRMLLSDTKKVLPDTRIIIIEPFIVHGTATNHVYKELSEVYEYAKVAKKLAEEFGCSYLPIQQKFTEATEKYGEGVFTIDGVHPTVQGATLIANEWVKLFEKIEGEV